MRKFYVGLICLGAVCHCYAQQDPLYNLYYYNQVMINPAYAGLYKELPSTSFPASNGSVSKALPSPISSRSLLPSTVEQIYQNFLTINIITH